MDKELTEQLQLLKTKSKEVAFGEHYFITAALQLGLKYDDLKELEYLDVCKMMLCLVPEDKKYRKATAEDWDKLM